MPAKPPAPVHLPAFQRLVPDLLGDAWAEDDGLSPADVEARLAQSPAADQLGVPVPGRLSVIGFDDIESAAFLGLSLWGYTTKRDLTSMGSFLMMGLFGLIIASVVNLFWPSGALGFAISVLGVVIFAGLAAYDTQKIKESYYEGDDAGFATKKQVMGALSLYLDFINMFLMLLRLIGDRR